MKCFQLGEYIGYLNPADKSLAWFHLYSRRSVTVWSHNTFINMRHTLNEIPLLRGLLLLGPAFPLDSAANPVI